jgi:AcrR family transcriptional regulator
MTNTLETSKRNLDAKATDALNAPKKRGRKPKVKDPEDLLLEESSKLTRRATAAKRDPEATKRRIMEAATKEFAKSGFGGARVDRISKKAQTNERMLYYYFKSKENLFLAVLENVFSKYNEAEKELHLDESMPIKSLCILANFMWDYYYHNPEFIRLLNSENLHEAKHLKQSSVGNFILPFIEAIGRLANAGIAKGVFKPGLEPVKLYLTISSLGYYILANRHTLSVVTGFDLLNKTEYETVKKMHLDVLISYLTDLRPTQVEN